MSREAPAPAGALRRRRLLLAGLSALLALAAVALVLVLDPRVAARHFSADGILSPYAVRWLGIYRWSAALAAVVPAGVAAWCLGRPAAAEARLVRWWPRLVRAALALGLLVLALAVAEPIARHLEARAGPATASVDFDALRREFMASVRSQLNADGLRDDAVDRARADGERRVLVLGDSFAFGSGIPERERTFPAGLERELAATGAFDVFNAGVPGADTRHELQTYRALRERVRPELVVVAWYPNDAESEADKQAYFQSRRLIPLVSDALLHASAAWRRVEPALVGLLDAGSASAYVEHLAALHGVRGSGDWVQREAFERLLDEAHADGRRVAVVLFPMLDDLVHYPLEDVHALLRRTCAEHATPCLDLLDVFRGEQAALLQASPADHHLNADGAQRAARAVAEFLAREGLLDRQQTR